MSNALAPSDSQATAEVPAKVDAADGVAGIDRALVARLHEDLIGTSIANGDRRWATKTRDD